MASILWPLKPLELFVRSTKKERVPPVTVRDGPHRADQSQAGFGYMCTTGEEVYMCRLLVELFHFG